MSRLTREEIEYLRAELKWQVAGTHKPVPVIDIDALCDLALRALSQEAVRDEALDEAAKICELFAPKIVETNSASELVASTAHQIREKILALKREPNAEGK